MSEEPEMPTIDEVIEGVIQDLAIIEDETKDLNLEDLRECMANTIANQLILLSILKANLNIEGNQKISPDGMYA